jgi:hypothetical protein
MVQKMAMRVIPGMILVTALAACGGTTPGHTGEPPTSGHSASSAAPASSVRTYPEQAADTALCNTFNTDIKTGDTYDIGQAFQQAQGTVSPKLASDIQVLVNKSGTLQQDMKNQLSVMFDCALVKNGVRP